MMFGAGKFLDACQNHFTRISQRVLAFCYSTFLSLFLPKRARCFLFAPLARLELPPSLSWRSPLTSLTQPIGCKRHCRSSRPSNRPYDARSARTGSPIQSSLRAHIHFALSASGDVSASRANVPSAEQVTRNSSCAPTGPCRNSWRVFRTRERVF